jgi:hypothetical protein
MTDKRHRGVNAVRALALDDERAPMDDGERAPKPFGEGHRRVKGERALITSDHD